MTLRFDRYLVDMAARRVLCDGADVHLTPKAFELLLLLIERRPAAVSKTTIMETLWPNTFVLEANVANLVAEVRAALSGAAAPAGAPGAPGTGDESDRQRFVRTVPRYGYAFAADIVTSPAAPAAVAAAAPLANSFSYPAPVGPFALVCEGRRLALPEGSMVLGREGVAAELLASPTVSRRHARLDVQGDQVYIEDLNSKNGCVIGGERITGRTRLRAGDTVTIGSVKVTLVRDDEPATQTLLSSVLDLTRR